MRLFGILKMQFYCVKKCQSHHTNVRPMLSANYTHDVSGTLAKAPVKPGLIFFTDCVAMITSHINVEMSEKPLNNHSLFGFKTNLCCIQNSIMVMFRK